MAKIFIIILLILNSFDVLSQMGRYYDDDHRDFLDQIGFIGTFVLIIWLIKVFFFDKDNREQDVIKKVKSTIIDPNFKQHVQTQNIQIINKKIQNETNNERNWGIIYGTTDNDIRNSINLAKGIKALEDNNYLESLSFLNKIEVNSKYYFESLIHTTTIYLKTGELTVAISNLLVLEKMFDENNELIENKLIEKYNVIKSIVKFYQ